MIKNSKEEYLALFKEKKRLFDKEFKNVSSIQYYDSPYENFRYRAEFGLLERHKKQSYAMTVNGQRKIINSFPIVSKKIQELMSSLIELINGNTLISKKLFQVEFQSSRNNEAMISLIYHKELNEEWQKSAEEIHEELKVSVIGRSKNQRIIIGNSFVTETYNYLDDHFDLRLFEQCFSQTNPYVCDEMINWVAENSSTLSEDIMELHCGIGTFTIPLSTIFDNVLATENSRPSIKGLKENIFLNDRKNIYSARLSGKETLEAYNRLRVFRRLKNIDLEKMNINSVFLDPPREGLDSFTTRNLKDIKNIIYVSCGFESFKRDIKELQKTHDILNLAMFDQFPFTDHIESGAILKRIKPD